MKDESTKECCPRFEPAPWEGKEHVWQGKTFIRKDIRQFFHMPLPWNMKRVINKMWDTVQGADAAPKNEDFLLLAYDPSPWRSELYMSVTKEIPGSRNVKISGTFITRVFDGPYNAVPEWIKDMDEYLESKNERSLKYYIHYTTCPKCAKKYGHNYAILFAQIK